MINLKQKKVKQKMLNLVGNFAYYSISLPEKCWQMPENVGKS